MKHCKATVTGTVFCLCFAGAAGAAEIEATIAFDDAWRYANRVLALNNATITKSDKEAGIIQADGLLGPNDAKCRGSGGKMEKAEYSVTLVLQPTAPTSTRIEIKAKTRATWWRYRKIAFIRTSRVYSYASCDNPALEEIILQRIVSTSKD